MSSGGTIELTHSSAAEADAAAAHHDDSAAASSAKPAKKSGPSFHMDHRIEARKTALKPKSLDPKHPPLYPVFARAPPVGIKDSALRVHPKGFRMLSKNSPLERNMVSYFRLPAQPPKRQAAEQEALRREVNRALRQTGANAAGAEGLVLDGFMLLDATGVRDPADATSLTVSDSNIVGAVAEDLSYFVNVTTADLGENSLSLADLVPLVGLEALHLHCNCLGSLAGLTPGCFPKLHTLNLSFNQLRPEQLAALASLPLLERLDLSCNALGDLPPAFAELRSLRQLALENNHLTKAARVFRVLGRLPELEEVNLNYNKLGSVPSLHALLREEQAAEDARRAERPTTDPDVEDHDLLQAPPLEALFPKLAVLGMGANAFVYFEDLFNLIEMPALEQVILWGNPIENRRKDAEVLTFEMDQRGIAVIMDAPVPGKKKPAAFLAEAKRTGPFVKVPAVDGRGLPRGAKIKTTTKPRAGTKDHEDEHGAAATPDDAAGGAEDDGSFFMTQAPGGPSSSSAAQQNEAGAATPSNNATGATPSGQRNAGGPTPTSHLRGSFADSAGATASGPQAHRPTRLGRAGTAGSAASGLSGPRSLPSPVGADDDGMWRETPADVGFGGAASLQDRLRASAARVDATATKRQGNIRTVMSELRSMLRQPLPPLNRPRFAAQRKKGAGVVDEGDDSESSSSESDGGAGVL